MGNLVNLKILDLDYNENLTGPIPSEFGGLISLARLRLNNCNLTGSIPIEIGNLSNLTHLYLNNNSLTGNIPSELGNLSNLVWLYLYTNPLSGPIPKEFGNLANLEYLWLSDCFLDGEIPKEIGYLNKLAFLGLWNNNLSGNIPNEIGNLSNLIGFQINSNNIKGEIPASFKNLINLQYVNLNYNGLYSNDPDLIIFLSSLDFDWAETQTIAPKDIQAESLCGTTVKITWTPILFTDYEGGYSIYYGMELGEYTFYGDTSDKTIKEMTVTGLEPNTRYYFAISTKTSPHINNFKNFIESYISEPTFCITEGECTGENIYKIRILHSHINRPVNSETLESFLLTFVNTDYYFVYSSNEVVNRIVGHCIYKYGDNEGYIWHTGDSDNDGEYNCFTNSLWKNYERQCIDGSLSPCPNNDIRTIGYIDWDEYFYNVSSNHLTISHFYRARINGEVVDIWLGTDINPILGYFSMLESGIRTEDIEPPILREYIACDIDCDNDCDSDDYNWIINKQGQCIGDAKYNRIADANRDGCITELDQEILFCMGDLDRDMDVDGNDLSNLISEYINGGNSSAFEKLASDFGRNNCGTKIF